MAGRGAALAAAYDTAARHNQRQQFMGMNAYDRHRKLVHDLVAYYGAQLPSGGQVRDAACCAHAGWACSAGGGQLRLR